MRVLPPRFTWTYTLSPYTPLLRSLEGPRLRRQHAAGVERQLVLYVPGLVVAAQQFGVGEPGVEPRRPLLLGQQLVVHRILEAPVPGPDAVHDMVQEHLLGAGEGRGLVVVADHDRQDRKSTRLNSSH